MNVLLTAGLLAVGVPLMMSNGTWALIVLPLVILLVWMDSEGDSIETFFALCLVSMLGMVILQIAGLS